MIRITYEFQTEDEALQFLARDKAQPREAVQINITPTAPKRGRPSKAAAPTPTTPEQGSPEGAAILAVTSVAAAPKIVNQPVQAVAQAPKPVAPATSAPPPPPAPTATLDTVRAALREVFNTKGAQTATGILQQFGATRISDVKPEQFAAFIAACS